MPQKHSKYNITRHCTAKDYRGRALAVFGDGSLFPAHYRARFTFCLLIRAQITACLSAPRLHSLRHWWSSPTAAEAEMVAAHCSTAHRLLHRRTPLFYMGMVWTWLRWDASSGQIASRRRTGIYCWLTGWPRAGLCRAWALRRQAGEHFADVIHAWNLKRKRTVKRGTGGATSHCTGARSGLFVV